MIISILHLTKTNEDILNKQLFMKQHLKVDVFQFRY